MQSFFYIYTNLCKWVKVCTDLNFLKILSYQNTHLGTCIWEIWRVSPFLRARLSFLTHQQQEPVSHFLQIELMSVTMWHCHPYSCDILSKFLRHSIKYSCGILSILLWHSIKSTPMTFYQILLWDSIKYSCDILSNTPVTVYLPERKTRRLSK